MGNTHWNLIRVRYLRCLSMWAEAKDLWGKTLPHKILFQVTLICAHLHFPSVQLVINRKERRETAFTPPPPYNGCSTFLCRLRTALLLINTVARNINFLIGMLYMTLWFYLRYRVCFWSILYKPMLILYVGSFCNEIWKMWLYRFWVTFSPIVICEN